MKRLLSTLALASFAVSFPDPAGAADTNHPSSNAPPAKIAKAPSPVRDFQTTEGFRVELVASDPMVSDPIAMAFDDGGRLYVAEWTGKQRSDGFPDGRIRLLEDTDGDGVFDVSGVFADDLPAPSAVICYGGGVFAGCGQEILFLKDSHNEGKADVRQLIYTDSVGGSASVVGRVTFTGFAWGLDNRIHVSTPGKGDAIYGLGKTARPLAGGDFAFDPRSYNIVEEGGSAMSGVCIDDRGQEFVCNPSDHLQQVMMPPDFLLAQSYPGVPGPLRNCVFAGADRVFSIRNNAAALRTAIPGPNVAIPITSARGPAIYHGDRYPIGYWGNVFVAVTQAGVVHRDVLRASGLEVIAERSRDEAGVEFLSSRDPAFQPVQVINAPNGCLYIADRAGNAEPASRASSTNAAGGVSARAGRIYRVLTSGYKDKALTKMSLATTRQLVLTLTNANGWDRETASRLLYERQDKSAAKPLIQLLYDGKSTPLARLRALHALSGLNALLEPHLVHCLEDRDDRVREQAVLLSPAFLNTNKVASYQLWLHLSARSLDPSIFVRYRLAFVLGRLRNPELIGSLASILLRDPDNRWIRAAVLDSVGADASELFDRVAADISARPGDDSTAFLFRLITLAGASPRTEEISKVVNRLASLRNAGLACQLAREYTDALIGAGVISSPGDAAGYLQPLLQRARNVVLDDSVAEPRREQAILLLGANGAQADANAITAVLDLPRPEKVQAAAILAAERLGDPRLPGEIYQNWGILKPAAKVQAIASLLSRPTWTSYLLSLIQGGVINPGELSPAEVRFLLAHPDYSSRQIAVGLYGQPGGSPAGFKPSQAAAQTAHATPGNVSHGRELFVANCANCHGIRGIGNPRGIDLFDIAANGRDALRAAIVDPARQMNPALSTQLIQTKSGETLCGCVSARAASGITLIGFAGETRAVPASQIQAASNLGGSIMPEEPPANWRASDLADLIEFIQSCTLTP